MYICFPFSDEFARSISREVPAKFHLSSDLADPYMSLYCIQEELEGGSCTSGYISVILGKDSPPPIFGGEDYDT